MPGANESGGAEKFLIESANSGGVSENPPPSVADRIVNALRHEQSLVSLQPGFGLTPVQKNVYMLASGGRSCHVKWIPADDKLGRNEVEVNRSILSSSTVPAPRMVLAVETEGGIVAAWEKLDGTDLRADNRHLLPEAFRVLARFHLAQRHDGPVHSNITDKDYTAIGEMLHDELELHCSLLPNGQSVRRECTPVFSALDTGFPTLAHGDFNPGNMIADGDGLHFVDWAYAHRGLNLLDLDYVQSVRLEAEGEALPWWTIGPAEAGPVLSAYFEACGLKHLDIAKVHRAVMLHAQLRSHANARRLGNEAGAGVALRNINGLLAS